MSIEFYNPFELLNSTNINNLNLQHDINRKIIQYANDLIDKRESLDNFDYFVKTRLNNYDLPTNINKRNVSTNFLLNLHGSAINKRNFIKVPKNVYLISLEHNGTIWHTKNIDYLLERIKLQNNINETFIKSIIVEQSLFELFKIKEELKEEFSIDEILNNRDLYIQKYYKVYGHNDKINDFDLNSDEKDQFYTGLFKLPVKSYIVYNQEEEVEEGWSLVQTKKVKNKSNLERVNHSANINSKWKVISHTKIKNALYHPENEISQNIIYQLIYPNEKNIRIEQNDYYTLHLNYLERLKSNLKLEKRLESMYTLKRNLNVNVQTLKNVKKHKILSFKNILQKLIDKVKPTTSKPLILFCNFCTLNKNPYYPQDNIIKNENKNEYNHEYKSENKHESLLNNNLIYLDYEKYVLNEKVLSKVNYIENVKKMIFDLYLCNAIYDLYIKKINKKVFNIKYNHNSSILNLIKDDINNYIKIIEETNVNKNEIKKYENRINDFYHSDYIIKLNKDIEDYKNILYENYLKNDVNIMNELCKDILYETYRLFKLLKKEKIYYNSSKRYFKEIRFFYNTFYPLSYFFTGNCTYAHTFIQYLLFIVYSHTRKVIKSFVYTTFKNLSNINNSNRVNIKDDYISKIIDIHYKNRTKKIPIISFYDTIIYNIIYDLHKVYTNNNITFGVYKRQYKSLLIDLHEYYDLYLENKDIYEDIGNLHNVFIEPKNIFENKNYSVEKIAEIKKKLNK